MLKLISHRISYLANLLNKHLDTDNLNFKQELNILSGFTSYSLDLKEEPDVIKNFYNMIEDSKTSTNTDDVITLATSESLYHYYYDVAIRESGFTQKDDKGEAIDLSQSYLFFVNSKDFFKLKSDNSVDYIEYLKTFWEFDYDIDIKKQPKYIDYLNTLEKEFFSYYLKSKPLIDVSEIILKMKDQYDEFKVNLENENISNIDIAILQLVASYWINQYNMLKTNIYDINVNFACEHCSKVFASEFSFNQHINGKSHKLKIKKLVETSLFIDKNLDLNVSNFFQKNFIF
jgi:hypothetical protein